MGKAEGNATEAARLAGYSGGESTLGRIGYNNTRNDKIRVEIAARTEKQDAGGLIWGRKERQEFWTRVASGEEDAPMKDRLKASELLGKTQMDFIQRVEHTGKDGDALFPGETDAELNARIRRLSAQVGDVPKG